MAGGKLRPRPPTKLSPRPAVYRPDQKIVLDSLPRELLMLVVERCERRSLKNLSRVSKHWRTLCIPELYTWIRIDDCTHVSHEPPAPDDRTPHKICNDLQALLGHPDILRSVRRLNIFAESLSKKNFNRDLPKYFVEAVHAMPKLTHLDIGFWGNSDYTFFSGLQSHLASSGCRLFLPQLKTFRLQSCMMVPWDEPDREYRLDGLAESFPNLERASVDCAQPSAAGLAKQLGTIKSLESLTLAKPSSIVSWTHDGWHTKDVEFLKTVAPNVRHLAVRGPVMEGDAETYAAALGTLPNLRELDFTDEDVPTNLYDAGYEYFDIPSAMSPDDAHSAFTEIFDSHPYGAFMMDRPTLAGVFARACPALEWIRFDRQRNPGREEFKISREDGAAPEIEPINHICMWRKGGYWSIGDDLEPFFTFGVANAHENSYPSWP